MFLHPKGGRLLQRRSSRKAYSGFPEGVIAENTCGEEERIFNRRATQIYS